jgi:DNA replication protein DnaC
MVYALKENGKIDWSRVLPCHCQAERIAREKTERLLKYCELPEKSDGWVFDTYKAGNYPTLKDALRASKALEPGSEHLQWLTLSGGRDLGKTHLAVAVCRAWLAKDMPAKYVLVPRLLLWLKESFDRDQDGLTLSAKMRILCEVPLLVLDDLGVQKPTVWAMEQLMTIIDYRYANHLPLMVTTNKSVENLPGDDEGRIGSRLKRYIPGKVIVMDAPEYFERRGK